MTAAWTEATFEAASPGVAQAFGINPALAMDGSTVELAGASPNIAEHLGIGGANMAMQAALAQAERAGISSDVIKGGQEVLGEHTAALVNARAATQSADIGRA